MTGQNLASPGLTRLLIPATVLAVVATAAGLATVGADARWLAALGHVIASRHAIPSGVPFATAATSHWPNVPVLGELLFHWLEQLLGDRGLMLAGLLAIVVAFTFLGRDALSTGADPAGVSRALLVVGLGSLTSLAVIRSQAFSLCLFPVTMLLLRQDARQPSRRIWLIPPLLALWSNLHGGVMLGLLAVLAYLALSRIRDSPAESIGLAIASVLAILLTPALLDSVGYYTGLLTNQAAEQGQGMWGALSFTSLPDIVLILSALVLGVKFRPQRSRLWEWSMAGLLCLETVQASRSGVWLLCFLAPPAASGLGSRRSWAGLVPALGLASTGLLLFGVARGPLSAGASRPLIEQTLAAAHGAPVLAVSGLDEQVALAGGSIVVGNPIDAFTPQDQAAYLDWLSGRRAGLRLLSRNVQAVLVPRASLPQGLMRGRTDFGLVAEDRTAALYVRRAAS